MRISIAMATYNGEAYLEEQLKSLASQKLLPHELVVCDDGSTDSTLAILSAFKERSPFAVEIHSNRQKLGVAGNFGRASTLTNGDILFWSDQDDVWDNTKTLRSIERLQTDPPAAGVFCNSHLVDARLQLLGKTGFAANGFSLAEEELCHKSELWQLLLRRYVVAGNTLAFRREWLEKILPIPEGILHDAWASLVLSFNAKLDCVGEPLLFYRQHGKQSVGVQSGLLARFQRALGKPISSHRTSAAIWRELARRVPEMPKERLILVEEKARWLEARAALPGSHWRRIPWILSHLTEYRSFENAWASAAKDFLAPSTS